MSDGCGDHLFAGATPLSHLLGSVISGSQASLTICAKEMGLSVGHVKWNASSKYDVRGTHGEEVKVSSLRTLAPGLLSSHLHAPLAIQATYTAPPPICPSPALQTRATAAN